MSPANSQPRHDWSPADTDPLTGHRLHLRTPLVAGGPPGDPAVRPFALRDLVDVPNTPSAIASRFCPIRQISVTEDGSPLPLIVAKTKTNPDGDPKNPPPWDSD